MATSWLSYLWLSTQNAEIRALKTIYCIMYMAMDLHNKILLAVKQHN